MLNISNNNIQNISALNACHSLQSLDASDNSIRQIEDLSHLTSLKVKIILYCLQKELHILEISSLDQQPGELLRFEYIVI
jgi:Leucine-rich repeat (LRR) protein